MHKEDYENLIFYRHWMSCSKLHMHRDSYHRKTIYKNIIKDIEIIYPQQFKTVNRVSW